MPDEPFTALWKESHYTLLAYLGGTSIAELMINGTL